MITAIKETTKVLPDGLIKLHAKGLRINSKLTVSAVIESNLKTKLKTKKSRVLGAHKGTIKMSDDFDAHLPNSFWTGK